MTECSRLAHGAGAGALATVAQRHGSLPMSKLAKMLVTAGGARFGTVGGGCLEAEIIERCESVAERRLPAVSEHTLNAELAGDYGLTCGGTAVMFIEPVFADETLAVVYDACAAVLSRGDSAALATAIDWTQGVGKVVACGGELHGSTDAELRCAVAAADPLRDSAVIGDRIFVEPILGAPRLVVFGGGHVGACVAQAAAFAGWHVTVVDDRPEFADPRRFPFAEQTVACDFHDLASSLAFGAGTYVVVATRGHQHDATIVEQLARLELRYLGMLGSRRKVSLTWRLLEQCGIPRERLAAIHAPVGIAIGADTPEEIAVSVVAEMIAVRRTGSRRRGGVAVEASHADGLA